MSTPEGQSELDRRTFIKGGSFATLMAMLGGVEIVLPSRKALAADAEKLHGPAVKCGVIGLGTWGREIIATLSKQPEAEAAGICDQYAPFLRRSGTAAPQAEKYEDYRKLLENPAIKAVVVATPTHLHKEIATAALAAGKHVYCEVPLAHRVEDAREIVLAAKKHPELVFQSGLQTRSEPQRHFLLDFVRAGAMGKPIKARAQWHKKVSWRTTSPSPEREKEMNWRLRKETSLGLVGEIGIHQVDAQSWFLRQRPTSVTGFGSVLHWSDGREVADTVMAMFGYPGGLQASFDCTLANSFDADYEMYYGTDSAIMIRGNKAWMFKEVDSPLLGWEVYARKDIFHRETGIALIANATKLTAQGDKPVDDAPYTNTSLSYALEAFLSNVNEVSGAVEDFTATFGKADPQALAEHLKGIAMQPAAGWKEGYEATVMAIKGQESVMSGKQVAIVDSLFDI